MPALNTAGPGVAGGENAHLGEIVGVDELVAVVALAEHEDVGPIGDPFEQDPEDAESTVTEDGPRPDDGDVEAVRHRLEARLLGCELGESVGLDGRGTVDGEHRIGGRHAEHRARRRVHHLAHTESSASSSNNVVPSTLTECRRSASLARGTWATLLKTTSHPSSARATTDRLRMSPIDHVDT